MVRTSHTLAAATLAFLSYTDTVTAQAGFVEVATDFGDSKPSGVVLPSVCIGSFTVPKAMYTFEPTNGNLTILSSPANLVETGYDGDNGQIFFKFNQTVAEVAEDAGVIIKFPADQLESVNVCCTQSAQIKEGFTNFKNLTVSTTSVVHASFNVSQDSNLAICSERKAKVNVKVSGAPKIDVVAKLNGEVNVDGNITSLLCTDSSTCRIKGTILEPAESKAASDSALKTESCEGIDVSSSSTCQTKRPNVKVDTSMSLVIVGEKQECVGGEDLYGVNGPAETKSPTMSPAPTISQVPTKAPTKAPSKSPTAEPLPTDPPEPSSASKQGVFASLALGGAVLLLLLSQ